MEGKAEYLPECFRQFSSNWKTQEGKIAGVLQTGMAKIESPRKIVYLIDETVNTFVKTAIWGKLEETLKYRRVLSPGTCQTRNMESQSTYISLNGLIELSLPLLLRGAMEFYFDLQPLLVVSITICSETWTRWIEYSRP